MRPFIISVLTIGSVLAIAARVSVNAQSAAPPLNEAERQEHWRKDLQALAAGLKAPGVRFASGIATRGQKDVADVYPHLDSEIASLTTAVPTLSDSEMLLRLMRLIASARIAHNRIQLPAGTGFLNRLPFDLQWFPDGLAVTGATGEYVNVLGSRVLSIGGMKPDQFLSSVEPYISHENETELKESAPTLMTARGVLLHFGMIGDDERVAVELEKPSGESLTLRVPLVARDTKRIGAVEGLHMPAVLYRSHPRAWYWREYLPASQTLFIQYNVCENDPKLHFSDFVRQTFAEADAMVMKRVVIDLRWNGGGNDQVIAPLVNGLESRRKSFGPVYVLIGPRTFSSAVTNAAALHARLSAALIGESTGGMPGGYGEVALLTLPASKVVVRFTTKRWGSKEMRGPTSLAPQVNAPIKLADFLAGRDPGIDAAVAAH